MSSTVKSGNCILLIGAAQVVRITGRFRLHCRSGSLLQETQALKEMWQVVTMQEKAAPSWEAWPFSWHGFFLSPPLSVGLSPLCLHGFWFFLLFLSLSLLDLIFHSNFTNRENPTESGGYHQIRSPLGQSSHARLPQTWLSLGMVAFGTGSNPWSHLQWPGQQGPMTSNMATLFSEGRSLIIFICFSRSILHSSSPCCVPWDWPQDIKKGELNNLKLLSIFYHVCVEKANNIVWLRDKVSAHVPSSFFNNLKVVTCKIMETMFIVSPVAQCWIICSKFRQVVMWQALWDTVIFC